MINAVIVEDDRIIQNYLTNMLAADGRFRVVGTCADAFEAEKICADGGIDLVLMDVQTARNHSGLAAGERIRAHGGRTKVVAVTSLVDPDVLAKARAGGADSLWYKDHGSDELMTVVDRTLAGEQVFPDSAPNVELKDMFSEDVTPRQLAILRRFVSGMTYDEIARSMNITRDGVRWNIEQIIQKGGFENKHELLATVLCNKYIVTALMETEEG